MALWKKNCFSLVKSEMYESIGFTAEILAIVWRNTFANISRMLATSSKIFVNVMSIERFLVKHCPSMNAYYLLFNYKSFTVHIE